MKDHKSTSKQKPAVHVNTGTTSLPGNVTLVRYDVITAAVGEHLRSSYGLAVIRRLTLEAVETSSPRLKARLLHTGTATEGQLITNCRMRHRKGRACMVCGAGDTKVLS